MPLDESGAGEPMFEHHAVDLAQQFVPPIVANQVVNHQLCLAFPLDALRVSFMDRPSEPQFGENDFEQVFLERVQIRILDAVGQVAELLQPDVSAPPPR